MHLSCLKPSAAIQKHLREPANRIARPSVSTLFRLTLQGTAVKGHVMHSLHDIKTSLPWPCHMPLAGNEPGSFAEGTITKRLPAILQSTANDVIVLASTANDQMREKLTAVHEEILSLRSEILTSGAVTPPTLTPEHNASSALQSAVLTTQEAIQLWEERTSGAATWLTLPWLLVECVMYVRLATFVARQPLLAASHFDMFATAKNNGWQKCLPAAADLATAFLSLEKALNTTLSIPAQSTAVSPGCRTAVSAALSSDTADSRLATAAVSQAFADVLQWSLWGNKTDLSLHVDAAALAPAQIKQQQGSSSGRSHQEAVRIDDPHVIVDNYPELWSYLEGALKHGPLQRLDIILDNSGLELFSDLILADFVVTYGIAEKVMLHGKPYSWFVSDTLQGDVHDLIKDCESSSSGDGALAALGARWRGHLQQGTWQYTDDVFWVTPLPFCWMSAASPSLYNNLSGSSLIIFKGDLNYRKLVHDCRWPATTNFTASLQGFCPAPLLSLRTLKADVVTGLKTGQDTSLTAQDPQWLVNGKWGVIQFSARA